MATADAAAVDTLVKLPNCRRLALSVAGEESYGRPQQQWRPQQQQQRQLHNSVIDEVSSSRGSTPRNSMDEGVAGGLRGGMVDQVKHCFPFRIRSFPEACFFRPSLAAMLPQCVKGY